MYKKEKKIKVVTFSSKKIKIEEYPKNTEIQIKMDIELKNKFKKLLCKGTTMSFVLQYRMVEDLLNKTDRKKYKKKIDYIENKVSKYITVKETEDKIIYTIDIEEKRIDIYLEEELKEMYVEMMKKLNTDVSSSLRYFVRVYSKEGNMLTTKKVVREIETHNLH